LTFNTPCSVPNTLPGLPAVTSNSNPCSVQSDFVSRPDSAIYRLDHQFAGAFVQSSYSQSGNTFSLTIDATAASTPIGSAEASFAFSDTYITEGSLRPGTVRGWFQPAVNRYGGFYSYDAIYPGRGINPLIGPGAGARPITLGVPFTVTAYGTVRSLSDDGTQSFASINTLFSLSFFEADGVTPVALTEVPEPTSYLLLSAGLLGLPLVRKRRKGQRAV
jgi:hypothetical protein